MINNVFAVIAFTIFLLSPSRVSAKAKFEGEFILTASDYKDGLTLSKNYHIVIMGGTATIKHIINTEEIESNGTASLTLHAGVNPVTRKFEKTTGLITVEMVLPGWNNDKFVTRIDLPFTAPPTDKAPKVTFLEVTAVEMLWRNVSPDGLVRYTDPMNVRMKAPYKVKVVKNPFP
jgi:hypothetical protein